MSDYISRCVNGDNIISGYDTIFYLCVKIDIWVFCKLKKNVQTFTSKTTSFKHIYEKVPSAKCPHKPTENIMLLSKS